MFSNVVGVIFIIISQKWVIAKFIRYSQKSR